MSESQSKGLELWLFVAQRLSALVLAPLVLVHLITLIIAVQGGLSAEEILGRTRDNLAWAAFYTLFVVAAGLHGAIGLRTVVREMTPWKGAGLTVAALLFFLSVVALGMSAVRALH